MKVWRIVSGIISMVLFIFVTLQSCAAGLYNIMAETGDISGSAGLFVAVMLMAGGIVSVVTRNGGKGGSIAIMVIFGLGALSGFLLAGNYLDLYIWASWCAINALLGLLALIFGTEDRTQNMPSHALPTAYANTPRPQPKPIQTAKDLATAEGMRFYCLRQGFDMGMQLDSINHLFEAASRCAGESGEVMLAFVALCDYESISKNGGPCVVAFERNKMIISKESQLTEIPSTNVRAVSLTSGNGYPALCFDVSEENIKFGIQSTRAEDLYSFSDRSIQFYRSLENDS